MNQSSPSAHAPSGRVRGAESIAPQCARAASAGPSPPAGDIFIYCFFFLMYGKVSASSQPPMGNAVFDGHFLGLAERTVGNVVFDRSFSLCYTPKQASLSDFLPLTQRTVGNVVSESHFLPLTQRTGGNAVFDGHLLPFRVSPEMSELCRALPSLSGRRGPFVNPRRCPNSARASGGSALRS